MTKNKIGNNSFNSNYSEYKTGTLKEILNEHPETDLFQETSPFFTKDLAVNQTECAISLTTRKIT
jgi:hypothetical protein